MSEPYPSVSTCRTHHRDANDEPVYGERFDEVLSFHPPGLAAVCRDEVAWHIRADGTAAYPRRFRRTFGFYEGLATVVGEEGWHHITPAGEDAYPRRYAWCGNFQQGRCAVREFGGAYFHIDVAGQPVYRERWRYAGDFREGFAVVQRADGRSTHVNVHGLILHCIWFLDLDVFHKGYARARDEGGWHHITHGGRPLYARRFAAVEPYYNGQARVERFDGGLEVIDETGATLVELRPACPSEFAALSADMVGFWRTQTIAAAVKLGLFEALPAHETELARKCGLNPDRANRLLRALGELRLVTREGLQWHLTPRGEYLRADHPMTLADAAHEYAGPFSNMWVHLVEAMREDSSWQPQDIFAEVAADAPRCEPHHRMLRSYALHDYEGVAAELPLRGSERVIDAGGGLGILAKLLLQRLYALQVTILERPEVVALAQQQQQSSLQEMTRRMRSGLDPALVAKTHINSTGLTWVAGDLFAPWGLSADVVILARVLHDWDDDNALRILAQARATLDVCGRLYVVEMVLAHEQFAGSLCDLHLLMVTGGRERNIGEFASLLVRSGFRFRKLHTTTGLPSIIEAEAI